MAKSMKNYTLQYKYECKFCGTKNLAWKLVSNKWTLFVDEKTPHTQKDCLKIKDMAIINKTVKKAVEKQMDKKEKSLDVGNINVTKVVGSDIIKEEGMSDGTKLDNYVGVLKGDKKKGSLLDGMKMKKTALKDVTVLYQPVLGSSLESTYYTIGLFNGLNMALRIRKFAGTYYISIRVEGVDYSKCATKVGFCKFMKHDDYASLHCEVTTFLDVCLIVGAMYYAVASEVGPSLTPIADLKQIITEGS